jgi:hypothetical protein
LLAVDPKNLSILIEAGSHRLASTVIEFYDSDVQQQENQPNSPFYSAAWFLLRQQNEDPMSSLPLEVLRVDVSKVLLWASRFGFHALSVQDKLKERSEFLQQTLITTTMGLVKKMDKLSGAARTQVENQIIVLWSHIFSPLLKVGTKQGGVPHVVTLLLSAHQYPPKPDWPLLVKYLSAVLHEKAEKAQVEQLLDTDFFLRLHERSASDPDHLFALPTDKLGLRFINGLMRVNPPGSILSKPWQIHLLTSNVSIPDRFATYSLFPHFLHNLLTIIPVPRD